MSNLLRARFPILRTWAGRAAPALALLAACLLAFGIPIPWLGLYADDWPFAYVNHLAGPRGVVEFISWVRPVAAWVFAGATALVGTHFWVAHALLLALRWLASLLLWRLLRQVWPGAGLPALWAALLFAVYPAFKQQPLAIEYTPHFLALVMLFGSLWISVRLAQDLPLPRRRAILLAILAWLGAFQVFILEYFAGLELLRPLLVWIVLSRCRPRRQAVLAALRMWLPFLAVLGTFVLWRVFVVGFPSYQPELVNGLGGAPLAALGQLASAVLHDTVTAGVLAWLQPFTLIPQGKTLLAWAGLAGVSLAGFAAYLVFLARRQARLPAQAQPALEVMLVGLVALLAAGWPFWITHIPLALDFPWDRTSLAFMPGACLLAAGALGLLRRLPGRGAIPALVVALLAAGSIGLHFQNANSFRKESALLNGFAWQLAWRAPGLAPGTAILLDQPPFNYHVDKFLSPLVNWTYAPGSRALRTPYTLLDFHKLWSKALPPKTAADPLQARYGTLGFDGDTSRALVVVYDPPGCLRVLTPAEATHLLMSAELKQSLGLTNLDLIQAGASAPARPPGFLGPEPAHDWCYFFEKAELALQSGDAAAAARLGDQALAAGYAPKQPSEYLVLVNAYAHSGRWEDALALSQRTADGGDFYRRAACAAWQRIGGGIDAGAESAAAQAGKAQDILGCR